ncbi:proteoglycan 4 [Synchiropus splendidus]|uniref:proteoglycan 4 n=1 Tax=Synchiropus splendidus TaxID=270530 RepID=UPI00237D8881|nr:proteoglycan 4 [Synchiropus splendidus]
MWSVMFVFLSYLDRNLVRGQILDADKENKEMFSVINGTLCAKMSAFGENFLYQVSDGAEVVRSVVSPGGKLVHCSITVDQIEVKTFTKECGSGLKERRTLAHLGEKLVRMDEAKRACEESDLSGGMEKNAGGLSEDVLKRSKRGFTYPGTLWCGAGNMADTYEQLGDFAATDSCCRTHDHCPHVIHAFSSKYGYTNFKWHSICHCDCDETLKACLRKVNDTSSRVVGQAFFNVIGVPCFKLKYERQCAERHWYGMCKRYETFPVAVIKEAVPYDYGGIAVIDKLTLRPPKKEEAEKPESPTQPTVSGPEEPSLGNMVTAAEDFIKVLATVSTSQSSATDSDKSESQTSEKKKKRKNKGKKKKKTKKRKGKGAKRGQKVAQTEEGAAVSKAEEAVLSNFISDSQKHESRNSFVKTELELAGKEEASNEVMKDEPAKDTAADEPTPLSRVSPKKKHPKKGRRKTPKPLSSTEVVESVTNTTDRSTTTSVPTMSPGAPGFTEKNGVISEATSPSDTHKSKRIRSKDRGDRERRKKRRKISSDPPSETLRNSSTEDQKVIRLSEDPTRIPNPTTEVPPSPHVYTQMYFRTSSSPLKKLHSKKRGGRNKRKKTVSPDTSDVPGPNLESSDATHSRPSTSNLRPSGTVRKQRRKKVASAAHTTPALDLPTTQEPNLKTGLRTSAATQPPMSPVQISLERAREQFSWKKRRKAAVLSRQQA